MSFNDRCGEAAAILEHGGHLPYNGALRQGLIELLCDGKDGGRSSLSHDAVREVLDHPANANLRRHVSDGEWHGEPVRPLATAPAERDPQALTDREREALCDAAPRDEEAWPSLWSAVERILADRLSARPAAPCAFCVGTHPADLDLCICGSWSWLGPMLKQAANNARPTATTDTAAQALRDAARDALNEPESVLPDIRPLTRWLNARADRLDPGTRTAHQDGSNR